VYFEVTIKADETESDGIITIGLCGEFSDLKQGHPGWRQCRWSIGYHGDDGGLYDESNWPVNPDCFPYGPGTTVGCGIDFAKKEYFFTRDGRVVCMFAFSQRLQREDWDSMLSESCSQARVKPNLPQSIPVL
jgi:hypothetical protein